MTFDLDFLGEGSGEWYADIYYDSLSTDGPESHGMVKQVTSADQLEAQIRSGGGYVVRLTQEEVHYDTDAGKAFEIEHRRGPRPHPGAPRRRLQRSPPTSTLTGEFEPIPTLNGTLDGHGHTITGLTVTGMDAAAAFILQNNGTIRAAGSDQRVHGGALHRRQQLARRPVPAQLRHHRGVLRPGHRSPAATATAAWCLRTTTPSATATSWATLESNYETGGITSWNHDGSATVENCYAAGEL